MSGGLESHDAGLSVRLVDEETGNPVAMEAHLWRLGVPEDEHWTEGDIEIATISVPVSGGSVGDLVPGRYRLSCEGQRKGAEDPPSFLVRSGDNNFEGSVRMPRTVEVHLRVFDEEGRPLERANCLTVISSRSTTHRSRPSWARSRCEKLPDGSFLMGGFSIGMGIG